MTPALFVLLMILAAVTSPARSATLRQYSRDWLIADMPTNREPSKRITAKSVFIAPSFDNVRCATGYREDGRGGCVKVVRVSQSAQLDFLLQRLNSMYGSPVAQPEKAPMLNVDPGLLMESVNVQVEAVMNIDTSENSTTQSPNTTVTSSTDTTSSSSTVSSSSTGTVTPSSAVTPVHLSTPATEITSTESTKTTKSSEPTSTESSTVSSTEVPEVYSSTEVSSEKSSTERNGILEDLLKVSEEISTSTLSASSTEEQFPEVILKGPEVIMSDSEGCLDQLIKDLELQKVSTDEEEPSTVPTEVSESDATEVSAVDDAFSMKPSEEVFIFSGDGEPHTASAMPDVMMNDKIPSLLIDESLPGVDSVQVFEREVNTTSSSSAGMPEASYEVAEMPEASSEVAEMSEASSEVAEIPDASFEVAEMPEASSEVAKIPDASINVSDEDATEFSTYAEVGGDYPIVTLDDGSKVTSDSNFEIIDNVNPSSQSGHVGSVIVDASGGSGDGYNVTEEMNLDTGVKVTDQVGEMQSNNSYSEFNEATEASEEVGVVHQVEQEVVRNITDRVEYVYSHNIPHLEHIPVRNTYPIIDDAPVDIESGTNQEGNVYTHNLNPSKIMPPRIVPTNVNNYPDGPYGLDDLRPPLPHIPVYRPKGSPHQQFPRPGYVRFPPDSDLPREQYDHRVNIVKFPQESSFSDRKHPQFPLGDWGYDDRRLQGPNHHSLSFWEKRPLIRQYEVPPPVRRGPGAQDRRRYRPQFYG